MAHKKLTLPHGGTLDLPITEGFEGAVFSLEDAPAAFGGVGTPTLVLGALGGALIGIGLVVWLSSRK